LLIRHLKYGDFAYWVKNPTGTTRLTHNSTSASLYATFLVDR